MQSPCSVGLIVCARGALWTVRDVVEHADCVALTLAPAHAWGADTLVVLHPADRVTVPAAITPARGVSRRAFWTTLARRVVSLRSIDTLLTPARASIRILPFQLTPVVACVLRGARRLLIADAVGLGKTVEAGLIAAELIARDDGARCLVLVPAGLCDQWRAELDRKFRLDARVVDAAALVALAQQSAAPVAPWSIPQVAVVSIDFAKRPEVLADAARERWDLLIVDEAHAAASDSDRYRAARTFAGVARRTVLLTATPHSGDDAQFAALTRLGAAGTDEPLRIFRRSRADVGMRGRRRSALLFVRPSRAEAAAVAGLLAYAREAWASGSAPVRLLVAFLLKRALSNPVSLALTLSRRRTLLESSPAAPNQLAMPWPEDDDGEDDRSDAEPQELLSMPALGSRDRELRWLDRLIVQAEHGAVCAAKLRALARFVRRTREPVLVFTEFRDTLDVVARWLGRDARVVTLHGGLDRRRRAYVVDAFNDGRADVLVSTDTGSAGLNLHARCRVVLQLELPWNPVRLEQRVGRVDRLGQARPVHALHLVARGTPEARVLARLAARAQRARSALGDGALDAATANWRVADEDVAAALLGLKAPDWLWRPAPPALRRQPQAPPLAVTRDEEDAGAHAAVQEGRRRLLGARPLLTGEARRPVTPPGIFVRRGAVDRRRGAGAGVAAAARALAVFELAFVDGLGRLVDEHLVTLAWRPADARGGHRTAQAIVEAVRQSPEVARALEAAVAARASRVARALQDAPLRREAGQSGPAEDGPPAMVQAGLFDRRAERLVAGQPAPAACESAGGLPLLVAPPRLAWVWWPRRD